VAPTPSNIGGRRIPKAPGGLERGSGGGKNDTGVVSPEEVAPGALKLLDRYFATRPDWEKAEAGLRAALADPAVGVEADAAGNA
jgi:hypothetical protein